MAAVTAAAICLCNPHATPLYMLDIFTMPILIASLGGLLILFIARLMIPAMITCAACIGLLIAAWPQIAPPQPPASPSSASTHVVFANMYFRNRQPERLADWRAVQDADIVVTAETTAAIWQALLPRLEARLPYHSYNGEIAVFSRWPLQPLTRTGWHFAALRIATPSGPLDLIGAHFDHPDSHHSARNEPFIERLQSLLDRANPAQTLVVGDFNSDMSGYLLQDMARNNGLHALPAWTGTWPSPLPGVFRLSLDNAFAGSALNLSERRVGPDISSDHRPIAFTVRRTAN